MQNVKLDDDEPVVPITLHEWREFHFYKDTCLRGPWDLLEPWFRRQGLQLFDAGHQVAFVPNRVGRTPDGLVYSIPTGKLEEEGYPVPRTTHYFARNESGHDVLIRLIKKGDDGQEELDVLQHVCFSRVAFLGENHCLPMLRQLSVGDMTFGVFPVMAEGFAYPWFHSIAEIFDVIIQLLEGLEFLHKNLVAHRDIGAENILINFVDGRRPRTPEQPFRSLFPVRYYFIDFELSVRFSPESAPEDRLVSGIPISRRGHKDAADYGRDLAPEIVGDQPYDPFKADIYQLGKLFYDHFQHLRDDYPGLVEVLDGMITPDPGTRPTASDALSSIRTYESSLSRDQLRKSAGPEPELPTSSLSEMESLWAQGRERKAVRTEDTQARRDEIAEMFRREDVQSKITPTSASSNLTSPSEIVGVGASTDKVSPGTDDAKIPTQTSEDNSQDSCHEVESVDGDKPHKPVQTLSFFRPVSPRICAASNICYFAAQLGLSFLLWCLFQGPLRRINA